MNDIHLDGAPLMIIETSDNRLYSVRETGDPNLAHVWLGIAVKASKRYGYVRKAKARPELVRKAASRIVLAPRYGYVRKAKARPELVRKAASRIVLAPVANPFA